MKTLLFLLLGGVLHSEPIWINPGDPVPAGLMRFRLNSPTQSMAPAMNGKEVCYLEPYVGQEIKVGDVVWFGRFDGKQVLHRVTAKNKRAIYTKGDANKLPDGWVTNDHVKFIVRLIERQDASPSSQVH